MTKSLSLTTNVKLADRAEHQTGVGETGDKFLIYFYANIDNCV